MTEDLIQRYKEIKHSTGHSDEFYKYEAIQHFQDNWDINSDNFADMLKSSLSKYYNLVFPSAFTAISYMAGKESSKVKNLFNLLYDESINLEERIATFDKQTHSLIKSIDSTLNGFQDERTVSVYLTFNTPKNIPFLKIPTTRSFANCWAKRRLEKVKNMFTTSNSSKILKRNL